MARSKSNSPIINSPLTRFRVGQSIPGIGLIEESYYWPNGQSWSNSSPAGTLEQPRPFTQYKIAGQYLAECLVIAQMYLNRCRQATLSTLLTELNKLLAGDLSSAEFANYLWFYAQQNRDQFKRWDNTIVSRFIRAKTNLHAALQDTGTFNPNGIRYYGSVSREQQPEEDEETHASEHFSPAT